MKWASWVSLAIGVWLLGAPSLLGYSYGAATSAPGMIGVLVAIASVWLITGDDAVPAWMNLALGVLLFISPWVLGYSAITAALWNAIGSGVLLVLLSLVPLTRRIRG
jgi:hypothetical protein